MLVKWHCNFGDSGLLVIYVKNWHFDLFHEQIVRSQEIAKGLMEIYALSWFCLEILFHLSILFVDILMQRSQVE